MNPSTSTPLTTGQARDLIGFLVDVLSPDEQAWARMPSRASIVQLSIPDLALPEPPEPGAWAEALMAHLELGWSEALRGMWQWGRLASTAIAQGHQTLFVRAMAMTSPSMVSDVLVNLAQDAHLDAVADVLRHHCAHPEAKASLEEPMAAVMGTAGHTLLPLFLKTFEPQQPLKKVMTAAISWHRDEVVKTLLERRYALHLAGPLRSIAETGRLDWMEPVLALGVPSKSDLIHGLRAAVQHARDGMTHRLLDLIEGPLTVSDPLVAAANRDDAHGLDVVLARTPSKTTTQACDVLAKSKAWEALARLAMRLPRAKAERWVAKYPFELNAVTAHWRDDDARQHSPRAPQARSRVRA